MKTIASIFLTLTFAVAAFGQEKNLEMAKEAFMAGNEAYKTGDYSAALAAFENADSLADGAAVHYNLGNTFYKLKKWPEAILHYERALKFAPANDDVRHNLALANERIVDRIETLPKSKAAIWWEDLRYGIGPDGWALISIAMAAISALGFLLYWLAAGVGAKRFGFFTGILFLLLVVAAYTLALSAETHRYTHVSAIVFTDKVDVKSEPREVATNVFVLHAGTKVSILDHDNDWYEISIASGNRGWIPAGDLEEI